MNWTFALAAFGTATGVASLAWNVLNYRLTGGRIQILAIHQERDGRRQVVTNVANMGRLDVSIVGYSVWPHLSGHYLRKLRWRLGMVRRAGFSRARRTLIFSTPSVHFYAPAEFNDGVNFIELPATLKAGSMLTLPAVNVEWPEQELRKLRIAIHLGSGRIVQAHSLTPESFRPIEIKQPQEAYRKPFFPPGATESPDPARESSLGTITFFGGQWHHLDSDHFD